MRRALARWGLIAIVIVTAACKRAAQPAEVAAVASPWGGATYAGAAPPKMAAVAEPAADEDARLRAAARRVGPAAEALVARLDRHLEEPEGEARDRRICRDDAERARAMRAMELAIPLGADAEDLDRARSDLQAARDQLSWDCNDAFEAEASLVQLRAAALALLELIPSAAPVDGWNRASELSRDACSLTSWLRARDARRRKSRPSGDVSLFAKPSMSECRGLASAEAVCACLARLAGSGATCELADLRTARARLAYVGHAEAEDQDDDVADVAEIDDQIRPPRGTVAGTLLYLIATTGSSWSALALADSSDSIDLEETPQMGSSVEVTHLEELPLPGGTLFWLQSQHDVTEHSMGDLDERGESSLLLCTIPARDAGSGACYAPLRLASWSQSTREFSDEEEQEDESCSSSEVTAYRFRLDATGRGSLTLVRGKDLEKRAGSYQLR